MGRTPFRIVVAEPFSDDAVSRLRQHGEVTVLKDSAPETIISAVGNADALLVRAKAHVTARIIDSAPQLRVIGRASPTVDHIDLRAANRRDIPVVYCPNVAVNSCAEFTLALMLALHRRVVFFDKQLRDGQFDSARQMPVREFRRCTVGLLGIDPVAECLSQMLVAAFGVRILRHDPFDGRPAEMKAQFVSLAELLTQSDVLSIHLRHAPETRSFVNAARLGQMRPDAMLVNTTRGSLVDSSALADCLHKRSIAGAALDVFDIEPLPLTHPLRRAPNCILTPHVAGATTDAAEDRYSVADDVIRVLTGEKPHHQAVL